jgi:hypothetical protein
MPVAVTEAHLSVFGRYLKARGLLHAEVAQALGTTKTYVYMLATTTTPSLALAARIEKWSRSKKGKPAVPMQSWITDWGAL